MTGFGIYTYERTSENTLACHIYDRDADGNPMDGVSAKAAAVELQAVTPGAMTYMVLPLEQLPALQQGRNTA